MKGTTKLWLTLIAVALGVLIGFSGFTFVYAEGGSYLSDDPAACINCHVMQPQYDRWSRSSHASAATCNDCHAPHDSYIAKYQSKAINGLNHSLAFTTGQFPDEIQITESNKLILEASCRHCHADYADTVDSVHTGGEAMSCIRCHRSVGHGL